MIQFDEQFQPMQDEKAPLFEPGQLVRHRRYGYRGVIAAVDLECQASEAWYQKNQTQPDRDQPWYHVLVDNSEATTYAAQTSLEEDFQDDPISHPLVEHLFGAFHDGFYERNEVSWPPSSPGIG